jgi:hypothetical protein
MESSDKNSLTKWTELSLCYNPCQEYVGGFTVTLKSGSERVTRHRSTGVVEKKEQRFLFITNTPILQYPNTPESVCHLGPEG